eukprot:TRINITY_DN2025_c0_g2_i1.p1 TRINITY_DN2025_c0_g2~~TRINITY_DN2025_c0_g2_i1.p1  ORF type:complete len:348 (-),score=75.52 TRINITY_DN2025_c0_g2_i1:221-1264(-)
MAFLILFGCVALFLLYRAWLRLQSKQQSDLEYLHKRRPPNAPYSPAYAIARARGKRPTMEDHYAVDVDVSTNIPGASEVSLFSVFDGHAGDEASKFAKANLHRNIMTSLSRSHSPRSSFQVEAIIREAYAKTDADFLDYAHRSQNNSGSTCVTAFITHNRLIVSNIGDSRAILCLDNLQSQNGESTSFVAMSDDHKPNRPDEQERIEKNGGIIAHAGVWRVQGVLATSRSFGDKDLKKYVISEPEFQEVTLPSSEIDVDQILSGGKAEFQGTPSLLVIATDGLWDVFTNEEVADFIYKRREKDMYGADELLQAALHRGSQDNITIIVVDVRRYIDGHSPYLGRRKLE